MRKHKRIFLIAALIFALLSVVLSSTCQEVYIPAIPPVSTASFTIPATYNFPAGIKSIRWQVTQGTATLINSNDQIVTVIGAVDGEYRFDVFVTDNNDVTVSDWVPVVVSGVGSIPQVTIPKDTIKIDTCGFDWSKVANLTFVLLLPEDKGGTVRIPDSTTVYKAIYGAMPPHIRLKDDASLRLYRFTRNYTINKVSTPVRFTLYKSGAWIRERQINGVWTILNY
jgi:hypothetical protein